MNRFQRTRLLLSLILSLSLISCEGPNGPDGRDGSAFLKVTSSDGYLYAYGDDNPSIPSPFFAGQNYRVNVGTYLFAYESRIYTSTTTYTYQQWIGSYSISINQGANGGERKIFWQEGDPGADGTDKYFTLYCNFNGPQQSVMGKGSEPIVGGDFSGKFRMENGNVTIDVEYRLKDKGDVTGSSDLKNQKLSH
ncbi:MAG: hypothetical protein HYV29_06590 [Ignavibacteriales bacterium]|nr:hypothetical protein [Ignavibacteriales bacterium]